MVDAESSWDRVDGPVLHWVFEAPFGYQWQFDRSDEPSEEVPEVSGTQLDDSLQRLERAGLVAGSRLETSGYFVWSNLRITANGLRVLGEWPPSSEASVQLALVRILSELAEDAPEEEAKWYRRAAGAVGRFATDVVTDVVKGEMRRAGGDIVS